MLNVEEKKYALDLVRAALAATWSGASFSQLQSERTLSAEYTYQGVFVSLHKGEMLRGCVGSLKPLTQLPEALWQTAQAAATQDPRFPPLQREELPELEIEISLLHPMQPVRSVTEIEIGKDGLLLRLGEKHGLLLPQVASRRGWEVQTFLQHLCRKAEVPLEAWHDPQAELLRFHAEVFANRDIA